MKDVHVVDKKGPEMVIKRPFVIKFCFETVYMLNYRTFNVKVAVRQSGHSKSLFFSNVSFVLYYFLERPEHKILNLN